MRLGRERNEGRRGGELKGGGLEGEDSREGMGRTERREADGRRRGRVEPRSRWDLGCTADGDMVVEAERR